MHQFYTELFPKNVFNSNEAIAHYVKNISLPKLTKKQSDKFEAKITKNEVKDALKNKATGNDSLTSNFTKLFRLNSKPHCYYPIKVFCLEN